MARIKVKVVPGSSRNTISGWLGDALKLRVTAPPEDGKANRAVIRLLSDALDIPASAIRISAGVSSPQKTVEIAMLGPAATRARLSAAGDE